MAEPESELSAGLAQLFQRNLTDIRLGLDCTRALLERLDQPHHAWLCVHVAGTNGKGSVCALLEAVLRAAGYRTGLYTSPHLVRFNERLRVNGACVTDAELAALFHLVEQQERVVAQQPGGRAATFFEFTTVMAFEHFRRAGVQIAVLETGMGGRLDATNVVQPLVSVITPIGLEHTAYLGPTLAAIAGEKAGIIKPGRPVVVGEQVAEVDAVLQRVAAERQAPLVRAAEVVSVRRLKGPADVQKLKIETAETAYPPVALPLLGAHQLGNCATAVAALQCLHGTGRVACDEQAVRRGLEGVRWPGRCQILSRDPLMVLDVAHNPAAARVFAASLAELAGHRPLGLIAGWLSDKDVRGFLQAFAHRLQQLWLVPLHTPRAMPLGEMAAIARQEGLPVVSGTLAEARAAAAAWARQVGGVVGIAGSLYLAGEVLEQLGWGESLYESH